MAVNPPPPDLERDKEHQVRAVLRDDTSFASARITIFQYVAVTIVLYLLAGFWMVQVQQGDYYADLAAKNRIRATPILAPRGKILDRDGRVIVDNQASFSLGINREKLRDEHLDPICAGLDIDCDNLRDRLRRFDRSRSRLTTVPVAESLTPAQIAFVEARRDEATFPELEVLQDHRRVYPREGFLAHVTGYVGEVSEYELGTAEFVRYKQGDLIGKAGVERWHNDLLMGEDGQRRVIVDNRGREINVIAKKEAIAGATIRLTIDLDLQAVADVSMNGRRGALVALDPRTGEVLALLSNPTFDPNKFVGRIRRADWDEIRNNPDRPMFNRAIQTHLAPGSTFKPIVAMAGLESGAIDEETEFHCAGGASFYGHYRKCHSVHGPVSLHRAIKQSCDVFFYNLGNRLGVDRIAEFANLAGLGQKTGIDLPSEYEGLVPSKRWKIRTFRQPWFPGEVISVAIGQGAVELTPLQLAHALGGLALGGFWAQPHLLASPAPKLPEPRQHKLRQETVRPIVAGMYGVMNEAGGTAVRHRMEGVPICGKTGTAQTVSNQLANSRRDPKTGKTAFTDNAWFVGYAPCDKPEIAVAALLEGGEHGDRAAPPVRDVILSYFAKKARKQPGAVLSAAAGRQKP
ncbi:MAG: penicillin-binding protein 2 [Bryobacteraceae bacterium]